MEEEEKVENVGGGGFRKTAKMCTWGGHQQEETG